MEGAGRRDRAAAVPASQRPHHPQAPPFGVLCVAAGTAAGRRCRRANCVICGPGHRHLRAAHRHGRVPARIPDLGARPTARPPSRRGGEGGQPGLHGQTCSSATPAPRPPRKRKSHAKPRCLAEPAPMPLASRASCSTMAARGEARPRPGAAPSHVRPMSLEHHHPRGPDPPEPARPRPGADGRRRPHRLPGGRAAGAGRHARAARPAARHGIPVPGAGRHLGRRAQRRPTWPARATQGLAGLRRSWREFWRRPALGARLRLDVPRWVRFSRAGRGAQPVAPRARHGAILDTMPLVDTLHHAIVAAGHRASAAGQGASTRVARDGVQLHQRRALDLLPHGARPPAASPGTGPGGAPNSSRSPSST